MNLRALWTAVLAGGLLLAPGLIPRGIAASTINPNLPPLGQPYNPAPIQRNFQAAITDVNGLQSMNAGPSAPSAPGLGTLWLNTGVTPYRLSTWDPTTATWVPMAALSASTGQWIPPVGGGTPPSIVSAATTDLGSVPNAAVTVTGSQVIASFGSSTPAGVLKFLTFTGAPTLRYNASLMILPNNTDLVLGAGESTIAVSLGAGAWQVTNIATSRVSLGWGPIISLTDPAYGGVSGDTGDNSAACHAALAALASTGGTLLIPQGTFRFIAPCAGTMTSTGPISINIVGQGSDVSVLHFTNAGDGLTITYDGAQNSAHFRDLSVTTSVAGAGKGINLVQGTATIANPANSAQSDFYRTTIRGADCYGCSDYFSTGLNVAGVSNVNTDGLNLVGAGSMPSGSVGINLIGTSTAQTVAINVNKSTINYFHDSIVYGNYVQGVTLSQVNAVAVNVVNVTATNGPDQLTIADSQFYATGTTIIDSFGVPGLSIHHNVFTLGTGASAINLIKYYACEIGGNSIFGSGASGGNVGISIAAPTVAVGCTMSANVIQGFTTGVLFGAASANNVLSPDNIFVVNTTDVVNNGDASNLVLRAPNTTSSMAAYNFYDTDLGGSHGSLFRTAGVNYLYDSVNANVLAYGDGVAIGTTGGLKGIGTLDVSAGIYDNGTDPTGTAGSGYVRATSPVLVTPTIDGGLTSSVTEDLATGATDNRPNNFASALSASAPTSNIWENFFSSVTLTSGTANGEINLVHPYLQVNSGATAAQAEAFESSMLNSGTIGTYVGDLAIVNNTSAATITGSLFGAKYQLTNANAAGGAVNQYAAIDMEAMLGGGSLPTTYFLMRNAEPNASIATLGNVAIGTLEPQVNALYVQGPGATNATIPVVVKNSTPDNIFVLDDAGNATVGLSGGSSLLTAVGRINATTGYQINGTAGATCTLAVPAHLNVVNGLVTLCN